MIDINLLPPEYGPRKLVTLSNVFGIMIFSLVCLSLIFSSLRLMTAVQDYSTRIEYYDDQIKLYRQQVEDIRQLGKQVKLLETRLHVVKELLREKSTWSDKLAELNQYLPRDGIWMDGITIEHEKKVQVPVPEGPVSTGVEQVMVNISGETVSVDKVGQFVANLENSRIFGNIIFDSAKADTQQFGKNPFIAFKLSAQVLSPGADL